MQSLVQERLMAGGAVLEELPQGCVPVALRLHLVLGTTSINQIVPERFALSSPYPLHDDL